MNTQDAEAFIATLTSQIQQQNLSQTQLQVLIEKINDSLDSFKLLNESRFADLNTRSSSIVQKYNSIVSALQPNKTISDIPGVRIAKWYDVDIDFEAFDDATRFNVIEIDPEGPFFIKQVTPFWQITDTDPLHFNDGFAPTGRILPLTAYPMVVSSLGGANNTPTIGSLFDGVLEEVPEINISISVMGSGAYWTNQPVSAASFYGYAGQPLFSGCIGWVNRGDRLRVEINPLLATRHAGRVRVSFHGFQIIGHVLSVEQLLGL